MSKTKLRNVSDELKLHLVNYLKNDVVTFLNDAYKKEFSGSGHFVVDGDEVINFVYDSILSRSKYMLNWVKIEFGVRNATDPSEEKNIQTYFDDVFEGMANINVRVLLPIRTFWEKATLIHVECHRGRLADWRIGGLADWRIGGLADWRIGG